VIPAEEVMAGLTVRAWEPGLEVIGEIISVDSEAGRRLGFTSDVFARKCQLFRHDGCVYVQIIEVLEHLRGRGHFTALLNRLWGRGYVVKVPNPLRRMELRLQGDGFERTDEPSLTEPGTRTVVYVRLPPGRE